MKVLVGPVRESIAEHKRRHPGGHNSCPRRHWIRFGDMWLLRYCSMQESIIMGVCLASFVAAPIVRSVAADVP